MNNDMRHLHSFSSYSFEVEHIRGVGQTGRGESRGALGQGQYDAQNGGTRSDAK